MVWQRSVVVKSIDELEIMQEAGRINSLALKAVREMIRPGIATEELDRVAEEVIRDFGAEPTFKGYPGPYPFPATLTICINEELVHGIPSQRELQPGDIVSIDCGTTYKATSVIRPLRLAWEKFPTIPRSCWPLRRKPYI